VPILGSPFRGWLTNDIGFNLAADVPYRDALRALERFACKDLGCLQLEVADRDFEVADGADLGFRCRRYPRHVSDLTLTEEAMLARMSRSTRWSIRKAERNGLSVEIARPKASPRSSTRSSRRSSPSRACGRPTRSGGCAR
jgi:hypothetical protein